jgi:hypothetical protein
VRLLALEVQFDEIDQHPLKVLRQARWGIELPHLIIESPE